MSHRNIVILSSVVFLFAGCFQSPQTGDLSDLSIPAVPTLLRCPDVEGVKSYPAHGTPTHRIIHLKNWHVVPKELFAVDIRDLADGPVSDDEIDRLYEEHLDNVESLQKEQKRLLSSLFQNNGLRDVYCEGLSPDDMPAFRERIENMKTFEKIKPKGETPIEQLMLSEYREDLLQVGAPGRLMMVSDLDVLPVEDAEIYKKANPLTEDGRIELDPAIIEAREDAMVKNMLEDGSFAFIVLGGGHDLSNNIKRLSGGTCEYLTVETLKYQKLSHQ